MAESTSIWHIVHPSIGTLILFLKPRETPGVEVVEEDCYRRTIEIDGQPGEIEVRPASDEPLLHARVILPSYEQLMLVVERVRRMFDLRADPLQIANHPAQDSRLGELLQARPGLRVPRVWDAFELASDRDAQTHNIVVRSGNSSITASLIPQYLPISTVNQSCAGSIALSPPSPPGDGFYNSGTAVTFDQTTASGWQFTGWQGDLAGLTNPQSLHLTNEEAVHANYNTASHPLSITSLSPPNARAGKPGFTLTINGTGFTQQSLVFIASNYRSGTTYVSSTQITVPISSTDIATAGGLQVGVENFPSGASCAAWYPVTFLVLS